MVGVRPLHVPKVLYDVLPELAQCVTRVLVDKYHSQIIPGQTQQQKHSASGVLQANT